MSKVIEVPGIGNVEFPDSMSDEAIGAAIKKNSPPSYPNPTLPKELQGPPPSGLQQAIQNVPGSALRAVQNPYGPGVPQGNPTFEGDYHGPTPESVGNEIKGMIPHPVEDPVGTALQIATLGKYRRPIGKVAGEAARGAVEGATTTVPMKYHGVGLDVPLPVAGAAAGGFAGWLTHVPYANEVGAAMGAAAPIVKGAYERGREAIHGLQDRFQRDAARQVIPMGEEAPAPRTPVAPVVDPEQAVMPPVFKNKPGVNTEPIFTPPNVTPPTRTPVWKNAQEAASHNEHLPTVTQADEFGKVPVQGPVSAPGATPPPNAAPASVQPPAAGPQTQLGAPVSPVRPVTNAPQANAPQPVQTPAKGNVRKPVSSGLKVSGGETPSGPEIIKPGSQPPGEKLIPSEKELSKIEKAFKEQDDAHQKTMKLIEEFRKKHPPKRQ